MPCANQILYPASGQISQTVPQIPRSPEPASAFKNVDINPKCFTLRSECTTEIQWKRHEY